MTVSEQNIIRQKFKEKEHYHVPMGITTEEAITLFSDYIEQKRKDLWEKVDGKIASLYDGILEDLDK